MSAAPQSAMILAAGLGTRMRPLTLTRPKPLIEVAGRALIDYALEFFRTRGVQQLVVNSSYMADMLEAHLRAHDVAISREEGAPLETGGGIAKALPLLGNAPFFCLNSDVIVIDRSGDVLTRLAAQMMDGVDAVLLLHPRTKAVGYEGPGDFSLTRDGRLRRRGEEAQAEFVFSGLQLLRPALFAHAPSGAFSMNVLYNRDMQDGVLAPRIRAVVHTGDWLHIGDPAGLAAAEHYFSR